MWGRCHVTSCGIPLGKQTWACSYDGVNWCNVSPILWLYLWLHLCTVCQNDLKMVGVICCTLHICNCAFIDEHTYQRQISVIQTLWFCNQRVCITAILWGEAMVLVRPIYLNVCSAFRSKLTEQSFESFVYQHGSMYPWQKLIIFSLHLFSIVA